MITATLLLLHELTLFSSYIPWIIATMVLPTPFCPVIRGHAIGRRDYKHDKEPKELQTQHVPRKRRMSAKLRPSGV